MFNSMLTLYDAVDIGKKILFSTNTYNAIFEMDKETYEVRYLNRFPNEYSLGFALHKKAIRYKNRVFFVPALANHISIYDLEKNEVVTAIPIDRKEKEFTADAIDDGDKIWIFPIYADQDLVCIDKETLEYKTISDFKSRFCCELNIKSEDILLTRASQYGDYILFGIYQTDCIVIYDLNTGHTTVEHVGIDDIFAAITIDDQIWIIPNKGNSLFLWNQETKKCSELPKEIKYVEENSNLRRPCNNILKYEGKKVLIPAFGEYVYVLDEDRRMFVNSGVKMPLTSEKKGMISCFGSKVMDEKLWLFPFNDPYGVIVNSSFKATIVDFVNMNEEFIKQLTVEVTNENKEIFYETSEIGVTEFLKYAL